MFSQARLTSKVFEDIETNSRHFKKEFGNKIKMISDHIFIGINYNYILSMFLYSSENVHTDQKVSS